MNNSPAARKQQPPTNGNDSLTCFMVVEAVLCNFAAIGVLLRVIAILILALSQLNNPTETEGSLTCIYNSDQVKFLQQNGIFYSAMAAGSWITAAVLVNIQDSTYSTNDPRQVLLSISKYGIGFSILAEATAGVLNSIYCANNLLNNYWVFIILGIFIIMDTIFCYRLYKKGRVISEIGKTTGGLPSIA